MWQLLKDGKYLITSIIVILLDGIITYFIPSYFNNLNYFYPMLSITLISFFNLERQENYNIILIIGILYDLLYSHILFYNAIIFLFIAIIDNYLKKYFKESLIFLIMITIINIVFYDSIGFLLVILTNYNIITLTDLLYKILHSLILNIMSVFVYFFLFKKRKHYA